MSFGNPANLYRHKQHYCPVKRGVVPTRSPDDEIDLPDFLRSSISPSLHTPTPDGVLSRGTYSGKYKYIL